jgi:excisionase family DNA binding protein
MITEPLTVSVPEAGRLLGLSKDSAYQAARRGQIPTLLIGGRLLVPKRAIEHMLETASRIAERA